MVKLGIICSGICQCRLQWKFIEIFMDVSCTMVNVKYYEIGMVEIIHSLLSLSKNPTIVIEAVTEWITVFNPIDKICKCKVLPLVFYLTKITIVLILYWECWNTYVKSVLTKPNGFHLLEIFYYISYQQCLFSFFYNKEGRSEK